MRRLKILSLLLILEFAPAFVFADEIPVLLMLRRSEQVESYGSNFVDQVNALVYREITENRVKLWDSQQKEIQITGGTLKEIEKNSGVSFLSQETIFVYEKWENTKKEVVTKTLGFSFVQRNGTDEEVSFGYVDFKDLNEIFMKNKINTNANGIFSSTYTTYLLSKNFAYNIVQFAGKQVKSVGESEEIKKNYVGNLKYNTSLLGYYPPDKYVSYLIDTYSEGTDEKSENSKKLIKAIEEFFINNQEIFFNMGGDRIISHIQRNKIKVTRIEVNEIWRKVNDVLSYEPKSMTIYINDSAMNEMSQRAMGDMEILIDEMDMPAFLKNKKFNMIITKINSQSIKRQDSYLYYKALMATEWDKVIDYVINY
ncbi:MAG: hypothetical protein IPP71_05925 [Bacteroidetes bacterium]|nr:hypothetical protein [Bacteroidota bacterium]